MAGSKKKSYKGKKQYAHYKTESRYAKNFIKKLRKHIKKSPNDDNAKNALENALKCDREYKRKTPNVKLWANKDKKLLAKHSKKAKAIANEESFIRNKKKSKSNNKKSSKI